MARHCLREVRQAPRAGENWPTETTLNPPASATTASEVQLFDDSSTPSPFCLLPSAPPHCGRYHGGRLWQGDLPLLPAHLLQIPPTSATGWRATYGVGWSTEQTLGKKRKRRRIWLTLPKEMMRSEGNSSQKKGLTIEEASSV